MNFASSTVTITLIKNIGFFGIGPFLGAFFAFCFYILSKKYDRKIDWEKTCKNEHAYLERHFFELKYTLQDNKAILETIIDGYQKKEIELSKVFELPIREDSSMKVEDKLFINRLETYINNGIKRLNRIQFSIVQTQDRLNRDLLEGDFEKNQRAEKNLNKFIEGCKYTIKQYDYYLDIIDDLIIENKILLKKHKNWEFDVDKMKKKYEERKEEIKKEKKLTEERYFNPLIQEQKDRFKKFGLYNEER